MEDGQSTEERAKRFAARWRQDFEDFHNELSGLETGRRSRFLGGKSVREARLRKDRRDQAFRDALEALLQDPDYRARYEALGRELAAAEIETDAVIANLQARLVELDRDVRAMEDRAARGPDGTPVFRYADGRVVDGDGNELPPEIAEGIIWPSGAPSAEAYFAGREQRDGTAEQLEDWITYRNDTLGRIRDRYEDRENPMSKDDLRDAIKVIQDDAPKATMIEQPQHVASTIESSARPEHTLPPLGQ